MNQSSTSNTNNGNNTDNSCMLSQPYASETMTVQLFFFMHFLFTCL